MTEVELTRNALVIHVQGMDQLWALKSRLEIPLSHVVGAEVDPEIAREWHKGIRAGGTHVPGVITAGTFYQDGERVFWDVHDPEKTVVIHLQGRTLRQVGDRGGRPTHHSRSHPGSSRRRIVPEGDLPTFDTRPGVTAALSEQGQVRAGGTHRPAGTELTGPVVLSITERTGDLRPASKH